MRPSGSTACRGWGARGAGGVGVGVGGVNDVDVVQLAGGSWQAAGGRWHAPAAPSPWPAPRRRPPQCTPRQPAALPPPIPGPPAHLDARVDQAARQQRRDVDRLRLLCDSGCHVAGRAADAHAPLVLRARHHHLQQLARQRGRAVAKGRLVVAARQEAGDALRAGTRRGRVGERADPRRPALPGSQRCAAQLQCALHQPLTRPHTQPTHPHSPPTAPPTPTPTPTHPPHTHPHSPHTARAP
jgi:hypothetical protein